MSDKELVFQVLEGAKFALQNDLYPSFCLVSNQYGEVVSQSQNLSSSQLDPTAHSEILAIREASRKSRSLDLSNLTLYTSIEPCIMCITACYWAKIKRIVYILPKEQLEKEKYEGDMNSKEVTTRLNYYIKLEQTSDEAYVEKMTALIDIWNERKKRYWNK